MTKGSNSETKTTDGLTQEIVALYDAIVARVAGLKEETKRTVEEFRQEQWQLQEKLKENLSRGESLRKKDFELLIEDLIQKRKERQHDVARMLEQFKKEEEEMAGGLRRLLGKGEELRIKDFKKLLAHLRARQEERRPEVKELTAAAGRIKADVAEMLEEFKKEREEMTASWRSLAATMQEKRARQA